jgi:cysteine desulfurase
MKNLPLIAISNGSACTAASVEPSHVLTAMGLDELAAFSSVRLSFGIANTSEDTIVLTKAINHLTIKLRSMVGKV